MGHHHHHHGHHGHHNRQEMYQVQSAGYGYAGQPGGYGYGPAIPQYSVTQTEVRLNDIEEARRRESAYQRNEHLSEAGAALAAGFALYERHREHSDPENARRHHMEKQIAEGLAVAGAGIALYEHHKEKAMEHELYKLQTGHKKHFYN